MGENEGKQRTASLVQVARLYYEENLSQQQIADRLGVSRSLVSLYLKGARDQGIVRIEVVDPQDSCEDLALALKERTGLSRVHVVPSSHNSAALTRRSLGGAVARSLESRLQDGDIVGFGWGRTAMEVANLLAPGRPRRVEVVPLWGESSNEILGSYSQINQIILQIATSLGGTPRFLLAPLMVGSPALRDMLLADPVVRPVARRWEHLTYACASIGAIPPSRGQIAYIDEATMKAVERAGAVGDLCVRYLDVHGRFIELDINERLIGISPEQLSRARHVIGMAAGAERAQATVGALHSGLLSELFVDEELARAVLKLQTYSLPSFFSSA